MSFCEFVLAVCSCFCLGTFINAFLMILEKSEGV